MVQALSMGRIRQMGVIAPMSKTEIRRLWDAIPLILIDENGQESILQSKTIEEAEALQLKGYKIYPNN